MSDLGAALRGAGAEVHFASDGEHVAHHPSEGRSPAGPGALHADLSHVTWTARKRARWATRRASSRSRPETRLVGVFGRSDGDAQRLRPQATQVYRTRVTPSSLWQFCRSSLGVREFMTSRCQTVPVLWVHFWNAYFCWTSMCQSRMLLP